MVLNGAEWHGWLGHGTVPAGDDHDVGQLEVASADTNHWTVTFTPAKSIQGPFEVQAALLAGNLNSSVTGGENAGRRLHHEFVALQVVRLKLAQRDGDATAQWTFDRRELRSGASLAVAVWVTRAGELTPVQATGGTIE